MTNAQRDYQNWLNGYNTRNRVDHSTDKTQLLIEQADFKPAVTDGKRRGFNGKQPRTSTRALSDIIVRRPGMLDVVVPAGTRNFRNVTTVTTTAYKPSLISTLPAIGNIE